ncbi:MAG: membrane protein insertion efficiency factor YidD [Mariprofundales bacterium]
MISASRTSIITRILLILIQLYRYAISPLMAPHCRYYPSCSDYAQQALHDHGAWRGSLLALRRLLRCHPWSHGGLDFVPSPVKAAHCCAGAPLKEI